MGFCAAASRLPLVQGGRGGGREGGREGRAGEKGGLDGEQEGRADGLDELQVLVEQMRVQLGVDAGDLIKQFILQSGRY